MLIASLLAALYYYHRADDEIRAHLLKKLNDHYAGLSISIGATELISNEGIRVRQLLIAKLNAETGELSQLAYAEEINFRCDPTIQELLHGRLTMESVHVSGLVMNVIREQDGSCNLSDLVPLPQFNPHQIELPLVTIQGGTLEYTDRRGASNRKATFDNIDMQVKLKRVLNASQQPTQHLVAAFDGTLATEFCRRIAIKGAARSTDSTWRLTGSMQDVKWSPALIAALPFKVTEEIQSSLRAEAQIDFSVSQLANHDQPQFRVDGVVSQGQWHPPRLPQPVTNLSAEFQIDNQGVVVRRLAATLGEGQIRSELHLNGFDFRQPYAISLTAKEFPVTHRLVEALPQALQEIWRKYQPVGTVSGQLQISHDGQLTEYDADVTCQDLSLLYHNCQYPITHCEGQARFRNSVFEFDLGGMAGTTPITINGSIRNPGPTSTGYCEISTRGWKPIDDMLIRALPPRAQELAQKLQVRGNVGFWLRYEREQPSALPPRPHLILAVNEGWINYEAFPYPVSDIRGRIVWQDGNWRFQDLSGWNDGCQIQCNGRWDATAPERPLSLDFVATQVMLDAELKRALRPNAQQVWDGLRPQGSLEELNVQLRMTDASSHPSLDINVSQRPAAQRASKSGELAFQPTWFPYRLGDVSGRARWRDGDLIVQQLVARHNRATLRTNMSGSAASNGSWQVNLTNFTADNVQLDNDLVSALPQGFANAIKRVNANGLVSIDGAIDFAQKHRQAPVESGWDLSLQLEEVRLDASQPLSNIFGEVDLRGSSVGQQFWSRGSLSIDSMFCRNVQLTQIQGPIWVDSARLAIGRRVPPADRQTPSQPLIAKLHGGRVSADAELTLAENANFATRLQLTSVDVATLARDLRVGNGNLSGQAFAELVMTGSTRGKHTFNGQGTMQLRNANMYELPIVLAILNRMSSGKTDNTAFTNSDVAFRISDGYVYFDRLDLSGDAITLKGIGEMSLDRQLNLDFYSIVGREQLWSPIVRPFLGEASRQFLQIHVDGTLDAPITRQEVLPVLNERLQQLFPEQFAPPQEERAATSRRILGRWK